MSGRIAHEEAERAGNRSQRRAQLVAHCRNEFVLQSLQALALGRKTQSSQKPARCDLAFDKIVLLTFWRGLLAVHLVLKARKPPERDTGRGRPSPPYRSQSLG